LSSILEALKKADHESEKDRGAKTPWPAPLSTDPPYRHILKRWWVLISIFTFVFVSGTLIWSIRRPDTEPTAASMESAQPPATSIVRVPIPVPPKQKTHAPVAKTVTAPEKQQQTDTPVVKPTVQQETPPPQQSKKDDVYETKAAVRSPAAPIHQPVAPMKPIPPPSSKPADDDVTIKHDPRIDLQALVYSSVAAERFVVINNRLLKEGASIENMVVVRINRDDVLLANGTVQWREAFTVR
jgi:cytoskeletal protein RodZ